jgi:hypothetical protein
MIYIYTPLTYGGKCAHNPATTHGREHCPNPDAIGYRLLITVISQYHNPRVPPASFS